MEDGGRRRKGSGKEGGAHASVSQPAAKCKVSDSKEATHTWKTENGKAEKSVNERDQRGIKALAEPTYYVKVNL